MSAVVIAIAGGTASGKTTVAKKVYEASKEGSVVLLRTDDYYTLNPEKDVNKRALKNYDHPNSIDFELLVQNITDLKNGLAIDKPDYDFIEHQRREKYIHVEPAKVIILEGILALVDERVRDLADIKIYVDTDADERLMRRIKRDMKERARSIESILEQYAGTVKIMHEEFVEPSKKYADVIIPRGGENQAGINMIQDYLQRRLG
jgi:uridine kinase